MMTEGIYDKSKQPTDSDVADVLGEAYPLWTELLVGIRNLVSGSVEEWTYSGKKYGWSLRIAYKKRPIIRIKPQAGFVSAGVLYGSVAYDAALAADLPSETLAALREAVAYPEGRGIRIEVRAPEDISLVVKLATIKLAH